MKKVLLLLTSLFSVGFVLGAIAISLTPSENTSAPSQCASPTSAGEHMVLIPQGTFLMGNNSAYVEERARHEVHLSSFWIDKYEVTNDQFSAFVKDTGYVTTAEREQLSGAAVFSQENNWKYVEDANWKHPEGGSSTIEGKGHYPVVQVSYADAKAYANWLGHDLPTEAQFEYVSQFDAHVKAGKYIANTWQGFFPVTNTVSDGYPAAAPVGCFEANHFGVYDMIGNVWEWTNDWYTPSHKTGLAVDPTGPSSFNNAASRQIREASRVIKGGSYLCAESYCKRYRASARQPQEIDLGTNHVGFRTVRSTQ